MKIKKIAIVIACVFLSCLGLNAQSNRAHYQGSVEFGIMPYFNSGPGSITALNIDYIAGCRINDNIFVGGGTGINTMSALGLSIPIYANFKYYIPIASHPKHFPFISASLGLNIYIQEEFNNGNTAYCGYVLNVSGGYNIQITNRISSYVKLGIESSLCNKDAFVGPALHIGLTF